MNPERSNKLSDKEGRSEPNRQMRRKSRMIPECRNRCHRPYSGQESGLAIEIRPESRAASQEMNRMAEGTITDNQTRSNVQVSRRFNREFDSNEIDESDLQSRKHDDPRISTFRGISIDPSDEHSNISDSIRFNREFDLNEIDESE
jgi:hypothetical protein